MPTPKIFHLRHDRIGLSETYQEFQKEPLFCVLCDALYLPKPDESPRIAKEFERIIKKYLLIHRHGFNEKTLKKAIDHAQKYFFKNYPEDQHLLKIAALVIVEPPLEENESRYFYVIGLGDFKLFGIDKPTSLLFYDPETPKLPLDLSLKKRFHYLTNAIGQSYLKNSMIRIEAAQAPSILIMSYGTYSALPQEKWIQYVSDFDNKKNTIVRAMSKSRDKEHLKHLLYISFSSKEKQKVSKPNTAQDHSDLKNPYFHLKKTLHFFQWAYKIAIVLILGLCILELTHSYPRSYSLTSNSHELLKNPFRSPDMQLNLRSFKKPIRFPFIKERAFVVDLKEKYDRQTALIDALNERIVEQDKALRDLQIKTYYPTPLFTINSETDEEDNLPILLR